MHTAGARGGGCTPCYDRRCDLGGRWTSSPGSSPRFGSAISAAGEATGTAVFLCDNYAYPCRCLLSGCLPRVSGPTSPRLRTAPPEASPPFRQSLLSIARGTARSDAPRMQPRPGTFRTRELSYRRLSAAGLRIAGCPVHLSGVPCAPVAKLRPDLSALVQPRS